jgi:N-acetylated-alpha-linked acidic dipeptidase
MGMGGFTPYHTAYDDLAWYERFADPDFVFGPAVASVYGVLATRFANAALLPFDLGSYPSDLLHHVETLEKRSDELSLPYRFNQLKAAIYELDRAALGYQNVYHRTFAQGKTHNDHLQDLNETLIDLERTFLHQKGIQDRPWNRSLFTAEDPFSGYGSWMLPGLRYELEHGSIEHLQTWEDIYVKAVESLTGKIHHLIETLTAEK